MPKLKTKVDMLIVSLNDNVYLLTKRISALEEGQEGVNTRLNEHRGNADIHTTPEQKDKLNSIIPDNSRRLYATGDGKTYEVNDESISLIMDIGGVPQNFGTAKHEDGQIFIINCNVTNTDKPMLKVNELAPVPIVTLDGGEVRAGQLSAGSWAVLQYSESLEAFVLHANRYISEADLFQITANFDNPVFMSGCVVDLDYGTDGIVVETAMKGGELFAKRTIDYADSTNIIEETVFYLPSGAIGAVKTMRIGNDDRIITEIKQMEFEEAV